MKKLIITCALVSLGTVVSYAQSKSSAQPTVTTATTASRAKAPSNEQIAEQRARKYQKDLGLTAEQYKGVYEAQLEFVRQDKEARAYGGPGEGQAMQMQMFLDQKFQSVMTPEQYEKYTKSKAPTPVPASKQ